ncbi:MAG: M20 family metallopeptidase [Candidatus Firestonebacteria bacterium]
MANMYLKAKKLEPYLVKLRRELHLTPELGFNEYKTSGIIQRELKSLGIPFKVMATGVVGVLKGKEEGKTIAVRADIDALPVSEETGLSFTSKNKGVMHACGHDAHTVCVLGAAKLLLNMKNSIKGNIKFIFQPAEEMSDRTRDGAKEIIKAGAMRNPKPDAVIALHVAAPGEAGKISVTYGPVFANADTFVIKVTGKGGHGASPHDSVDPVVASAAVILNLQSIVSRNISPLESAVVTVTMINAGEAPNVIPPSVKMEGTARSLNEKTRKIIKTRMKQIVNETAKAFGARAEIAYFEGYPAFCNDKTIISLMERAGVRLFGRKNVILEKNPSMGGENFSYFAKLAPGGFIRLGVGNKKRGITNTLHHPKFTIDEASLPVGASVLAETCVEFLNS